MILEKKLAKILTAKKLTISTAESCTGGLLASRLTDISGSSGYFLGGFITYSPKTKEKSLKISRKLIVKYGTVSKECAKEMAKNVKMLTDSDISLSTTGITGPLAIENKKIGEVYIGLAADKKTIVKKYNFSGTRRQIKHKAVSSALELLEEYLCQ